jgi:ribose 5-phosphate isomerase B
MKVYIATDHAGFELKNFLAKKLEKSYKVIDLGAYSYNKNDDYVDVCIKCAQNVQNNISSDVTENYTTLGIVIGGSGNGEQIVANRIKGIRAALCYDINTAKLAREHNNANIIGVGARMHTKNDAFNIVKTFLDTKWSNDSRHKRRLEQIKKYEEENN